MAHIGILTYHRSVNYGAVMQALALADTLKKRYADSEIDIIDYTSRKMDVYYKMFTLYRGRDSVMQLGSRVKMYNAFRRGWKQMPLSESKLVSDDIQRFNRWIARRYDIIISGSDAIWNYSKRGLPNPYFLKDVPVKRLSYAASCNGLGIHDFSEIKGEDREFLCEAFKEFSYIGVRDEQTAAMVHAVLPNAQIHYNCDPSLLLGDLSEADRKQLKEKLMKLYGFDSELPTVGLMLSNHNGNFSKMFIDRLHAEYGKRLQTVAIYSYCKNADIPYVSSLTPQEWSIVFGLFDITISKYFHGTLFSLLNRTPVMSVGAEKKIGTYPNKIEDVLGSMGLEELYFPARSGKEVNWSAFMERFDALLQHPITDRIEQGIESEQKKADSFFACLDKLV